LLRDNCDALFAGGPNVVADLYEWLPPYGETAVSFRCEGLDLFVEVSYDDESNGVAEEKKRTVRFSGVCAFYVAACPGVDLTCVKYSDGTGSGAVVEYTESEAARMWREKLEHRQRPIRHFQVFFLAENRRLEVFAEECVSS
jgi:hypothetical protein